MISQTENELWFELTSTEETLKKYPFPFVLYIGYTLLGNILTVMWKVKNPAKKTMYFSIGAHPAFLCPIHGEKNKEGYALSFGDVQEIHHHGNTVDTGMALEEDLILPLKNGMTKITPEFFDRCTYMIEGKQTGKAGLVDSEGNEYITVFFDAPLFAICLQKEKMHRLYVLNRVTADVTGLIFMVLLKNVNIQIHWKADRNFMLNIQ